MENSKTIPTWTCDNCGYAQDFEPTAENMAIHFPEAGIRTDGTCPACHMGKNPPEMATEPENDHLTPELDPEKMSREITKE